MEEARPSPTPAPASTPRRRGRPRSEAVGEAILEAAARLLGERGYAALTMEGIAAEAGISKPTLYLRYGGKAEVVAAAFARLRMGAAPAPAGDLRADLVAQLRHLRRVYATVGMSVLGVCLAEEEHEPDLIAGLREGSLEPGRRLMRDAMAAARERGEIAADADLDTAVEMAVGAFYAHHLAGTGFDEGWAERVVDALLRGLRPAS
ncbi:TetR/AcrR family transcriptional regulator [Miltoncostaea marina]|uniref:TetR/AcrR family transcriptional regulator n=1 Tax=Miltoncostaea marina TaxID=2843215 RepID=UPI001C3C927C|nr:TetR/AcrR family transcriptional regulator [Miltoncostaea marina]